MHPHQALITGFYTAFQKRDGAAMAACYHPEVHFSDPVFPDLHGAQAGGMWKMLCDKGKDLRLEFRDISADDRSGRAHWEAWYAFSATGRPVHNVIEARFEFRDGKIVRHQDQFSFHRWAGQALGPMGTLLGWTPFLRNKVRTMAGKNLDAFLKAAS